MTAYIPIRNLGFNARMRYDLPQVLPDLHRSLLSQHTWPRPPGRVECSLAVTFRTKLEGYLRRTVNITGGILRTV